MVGLKNPPKFVADLEKALVKGLGEAGIRAKVMSEPVPHTKMYRFAVFSPQFKEMYHSERQRQVWRIAEDAIKEKENQLRISMILTLTSDEAKGK